MRRFALYTRVDPEPGSRACRRTTVPTIRAGSKGISILAGEIALFRIVKLSFRVLIKNKNPRFPPNFLSNPRCKRYTGVYMACFEPSKKLSLHTLVATGVTKWLPHMLQMAAFRMPGFPCFSRGHMHCFKSFSGCTTSCKNGQRATRVA